MYAYRQTKGTSVFVLAIQDYYVCSEYNYLMQLTTSAQYERIYDSEVQ